MPSSGQRGARREVGKGLELFTKRGWEVAQRETRGKGHARRCTQEAVASGYEAVAINVAVNGLIETFKGC